MIRPITEKSVLVDKFMGKSKKCQTFSGRDKIHIKANGPAVEGVNITRRMHRLVSRYFSQKAVKVQGGYGAIFAIPAKDKVFQWQDLSRAEITSLIKN